MCRRCTDGMASEQSWIHGAQRTWAPRLAALALAAATKADVTHNGNNAFIHGRRHVTL